MQHAGLVPPESRAAQRALPGRYERYAFFLIAGAWASARFHGCRSSSRRTRVSGIASRPAQHMTGICAAIEASVAAALQGNLDGLLVPAGSHHRTGCGARSGPRRSECVRHGRVRGVKRDPALAALRRRRQHRDRLRGLVRQMGQARPPDSRLQPFAALAPAAQVAARRRRTGYRPPQSRMPHALASRSSVVFAGAVPRKHVLEYASLLDVAVLPHLPTTSDRLSSCLSSWASGFRWWLRVSAPSSTCWDGRSAVLFDPLDEEQMQPRSFSLVDSAALRAVVARRACQTSFRSLLGAQCTANSRGGGLGKARERVARAPDADLAGRRVPVHLPGRRNCRHPRVAWRCRPSAWAALRAQSHSLRNACITNALAHGSPVRRVPEPPRHRQLGALRTAAARGHPALPHLACSAIRG